MCIARAVSILFLAAASWSAAADVDPSDAGLDDRAPADGGCQCVDDPLAELFEGEPQSRPRVVEKIPKAYPPGETARRRRGLERIATTLYDVHSGEALPVLADHMPADEVLGEFFRCRGFGTRARLDPRLLETIVAAAEEHRSPRVLVYSAYRSPKFNDALAKKGRRVAAESRHTRGEAIDFALEGVPAARLGAWLWERFEGGVGVYRHDGFVHIDVGPKRRWSGR